MCQTEFRTPSGVNVGGSGIWRQVRRCKRVILRRRSSSSLSTTSSNSGEGDGWMLLDNNSLSPSRRRRLINNSSNALWKSLMYSNTASRYLFTFLPFVYLYWGFCEARKRGGCAARRLCCSFCGSRYSSIKNYVAVSDTQPFDDAELLPQQQQQCAACSSPVSDEDEDHAVTEQQQLQQPLKRRQRLLNRLRRFAKRRVAYDQQPAACSPWNVPLLLVFYQFLPLRALSRAWGWVNDMYLPWMLRVPVLGMYVWMCGCNLREADCCDLTKYRNLGMFFRRRLRAGIRPVSMSAALVSPADGQVIHFGRIDTDRIEQVKGLTYSLAAFLGPQSWKQQQQEQQKNAAEKDAELPTDADAYRYNLMHSKSVAPAIAASETNAVQDHSSSIGGGSSSLFHCVIYLSPGDYHRFHSPTEWQVFFRRHFPGTLFSVSPRICRYIEGLFNFNERVAYIGHWAHGFFATIAVGATNVGTIKVHFDEDLKTNCNTAHRASAYEDFDFRQRKKAVALSTTTTHSTSASEDPCVAGNEEFTFQLNKVE